jgi:hypothetical protein
MIIGRSPRGAPNSAQSPGRLTAGARPEFHYVTSVQTVSSPWTSHVTLAARTCSPLIQTPNGPVLCRVGVGNPSHTDLIAGLNWGENQLSRTFEGPGGGTECVTRQVRFLPPRHPGLAPIVGCGALLNFVTARVEPGSQSRRDASKANPRPCGPFVSSDPPLLRHEWDHDRGGFREVEQAYRNCEGVCRDLGNG